MKKAFVLAGLGFGDETKGATTHYLCHIHGAHTVIRTGGAQAFHGVITEDGKDFVFSTFGSGSFCGAKTYLSEKMVIEPYATFEEGLALEKLGVDAFNLLTIDELALVITPFQKLANQIKELARGKNRHGTVGIGVGETILDSELLGDQTIRAKDLNSPKLKEKLETNYNIKLQQLEEIFCGEKTEELSELINLLLQKDKLINWAVTEFNALADSVNIVDGSYLDKLLKEPGVIVCEPSQGLLLDRWYGFYPYVTRATPTPDAALGILHEHGYDGEIVNVGITRAYATRHGAGPFVTENQELSKKITDQDNGNHPWQGKFRVGHLDLLALRYSVEACSAYTNFDALAVSCLDRLTSFPTREICESYKYIGTETDILENYFTMDGEIITGMKVRPNSQDEAQVQHQQKLGELLRDCQPILKTLPGKTHLEYIEAIENALKIPVKISAFGPTEKDRRHNSL